jgi:malic enzyme
MGKRRIDRLIPSVATRKVGKDIGKVRVVVNGAGAAGDLQARFCDPGGIGQT